MAPDSDGGCQISKFEIFRDDGNGGSITTSVANATGSIYKQTVTLAAGSEGKLFRIKVVASNAIGIVESSSLSFVLADIPDKPTPKPAVVAELTNTH